MPLIPVMETPALLPSEAVTYLSDRGLTISDETLRRWADKGQLRHLRLPSGQIRFRPEDLDELLTPVEPTEAAS